MVSFLARVTRVNARGASGGYVIRLTAEQVATLPGGGAHFVVRLSHAENPKTTLVPTMETCVKRYGRDSCLVVPSALITGGVLRARHDVLVTTLSQQF